MMQEWYEHAVGYSEGVPLVETTGNHCLIMHWQPTMFAVPANTHW